MKKGLIVTAIIAMMAVPAMASNQKVTKLDFCTVIGRESWLIMGLRQDDVSITSMLDWAKSTNPAMRDAIKSIVLDAYSIPRYSNKIAQKQSKIDFTSKHIVGCFVALFK